MSSPLPAGVPVCYRHPGRETHISCQRCGRPICPECMNDAAVGFHCPACVAEGRRTVRAPTTPYGGTRPGNPALTSIALVVVNVGVFVALLATGGIDGTLGRLLTLTPRGVCEAGDGRFFPGVSVAAACPGTWVDGVASGAWWQLVTSGFAHVAPLHLAFNMLALYFLGPQVEQVMGRARFLALYVVSLLAGSVAVLWLAEPYSSTLGASGAVFGLMGALLLLMLRLRADPRPLAAWLAINVLITVAAGNGISWQGHLGGFLGGVAAAAVIVLAPRVRRAWWQAAGLLLVVAALLGLVALRVAELA
ncbi:MULTISPECIES: rhomboid family intramembrane serine protease [unclassified Nocardioides]|uniref:rhomboid family intramembrane serine protease n=1 Tax=unclassified Nocardioides TaxID=2615069 RepID=UPI002405FBD2|nr:MULTISPECIES: rhomboid family intramembrane serine protease [unclassified Nocardioides]